MLLPKPSNSETEVYAADTKKDIHLFFPSATLFFPGRLCNYRAACIKACYDTPKVDGNALCHHSPHQQCSSCICGLSALRIYCHSHMGHVSFVTFCNCIHTASSTLPLLSPPKGFTLGIKPSTFLICLQDCETHNSVTVNNS